MALANAKLVRLAVDSTAVQFRSNDCNRVRCMVSRVRLVECLNRRMAPCAQRYCRMWYAWTCAHCKNDRQTVTTCSSTIHATLSWIAAQVNRRFRFDEVAQLVTGDPKATSNDGVEWIEQLCKSLFVPSLATYGIQHDHLQGIVAELTFLFVLRIGWASNPPLPFAH